MSDKSTRWVAVRRTLYQSEKLNAVSEGAEVLYRRLLEVCDDGGNYYGEPGLVLGYAFAHRLAAGTVDIAEMSRRLTELATVGLVVIYNGGKLLHIVNHFSRMRTDVAPDIRFDAFRNESVTDPSRERNGCGPLDRTEPNQTVPDRTECTPPAVAVGLARLLATKNPYVKKQTEANLTRWAREFDRCLRLDANGNGQPRWTAETLTKAIEAVCATSTKSGKDNKAQFARSPKQIRADWFYAWYQTSRPVRSKYD